MDISDTIARLTPAERERFKDLITECIRRENEIRANRDRADRALTHMTEALDQFYRDVATLTNRAGLLYLKLAPPAGPVQ